MDTPSLFGHGRHNGRRRRIGSLRERTVFSSQNEAGKRGCLLNTEQVNVNVLNARRHERLWATSTSVLEIIKKVLKKVLSVLKY